MMNIHVAAFSSQKTIRSWALPAAVLFFTLPTGTPLRAQESILELDPAQTHIQFTLEATLHTVHGTFKLKQGMIRFDPGTGKAGGQVLVNVASGETGNQGRDRKMHTDVLQSAQYPEATFTPTRFKGSLDPNSGSVVEVNGVLNIHGSNHEIKLTIQAKESGDQLTAATQFEIPYQQWGLKNPSTFFLRVSDKVEIHIQTAGRLTLPAGH